MVSGVVLSYELGTNWSRFSRIAGNIVGPLAGYEVLSAFSWRHLPRHPLVRRQTGAALAAHAVGGNRRHRHRHLGVLDPVRQLLDAHAGRIRDARRVAFPLDWWAIVSNPSFPYRFADMLNASYLTAGFVVLAVGARYLLKGDHVEETTTLPGPANAG